MPGLAPANRVATVTLEQARRIALAAQGFADPLPGPGRVERRHVRRVLDRVQIVQIDSVSAVVRSHYLPFYSRLGAYPRELLDRARDVAPRDLVEYWAHAASLISPATWPLLGFRMRRADDEAWGGMRQVARTYPDLVSAVLEEVRRAGPLTARELEAALAHDLPRSRDDWGWNWSLVKHAAEHLFWAGRISSAGRTGGFERRYAACDVVAPPLLRAAWATATEIDEDEAVTQLAARSARALGIGSRRCLRDYFRLTPAQTDRALTRLLRDGIVEPVRVTGWPAASWRHAQARAPRAVPRAALLSPFDSLIWDRGRTSAVFGFDYRLEIYVPAARRRYGYYVLPFLFDERLVARCDLRADRERGVLRHRVTWEPAAPPPARRSLEDSLGALAQWLGLSRLAPLPSPAS